MQEYERAPDTNLLEETLKEIINSGHTVNDVHHVMVKDKEKEFFGKDDPAVAISWEDFEKISSDFNYYHGYGTEYVWVGCKVIFSDRSYLKRNTYDGSEWWEFVDMPNLNVTIEKYNSNSMSINDIESEEDIILLKKKQKRIEAQLETKVIREKLDTKAFTLKDFLK